MLNPKTMANATIGTSGNTLPVPPGTPRNLLPCPSWITKTNAPKAAATEKRFSAMAFTAAKIDRKPQSRANSVPHYQRHYRRKALSDNRFIVGVECRDAPNEKACARHSGESWRAGLTELPHPVDLVAQGDRTRG